VFHSGLDGYRSPTAASTKSVAEGWLVIAAVEVIIVSSWSGKTIQFAGKIDC
jgi:hypothetical protein